ncbi:hypothetical protein SDC9_18808 [bioreactor metagenome]|uniref:TIGR04076: TIGR04076 family protein n=3 Tax=root TaxID=1 RepID=A0A098B132_DESHA|nr:TIGR04076 family protein [Desulfitobacterium hafniense]EHL08708.1 hypothetical protein HMPREF0322_00565 [Desulfitobacterium hafniense DP7]MEA5024763.1 TIGR04076 family protein [Desulfitobacterium hafniense]CDX02584.1 TIGR04076: TIGR04076 family protein [Desulfitobacterium hafniense]
MKVEMNVKSIKRHCAAGYKEGDKVIYSGPNITSCEGSPLCLYALSSFIPYLTAFGRETEDKDWINQLRELQCPDPANTVVFSLRRN